MITKMKPRKNSMIFSGGASPMVITPKPSNQKMILSAGINGEIKIEKEPIDYKILSPIEREDTGTLVIFYNQPISFYDIPTINLMTYPLKLWHKLLNEDEFTGSALEQHSLWGENNHTTLDYVDFNNTSLRIEKFWDDGNNVISGEVHILDTAAGRDLFSLCKTGRPGLSSRGVGDLLPDFAHGCEVFGHSDANYSTLLASNEEEWQRFCTDPTQKNINIELKGFTIVDPEPYVNVCWDAVSYPAVPIAAVSIAPKDVLKEYLENNPVEKRLRDFMTASSVRDVTFKEGLAAAVKRK